MSFIIFTILIFDINLNSFIISFLLSSHIINLFSGKFALFSLPVKANILLDLYISIIPISPLKFDS